MIKAVFFDLDGTLLNRERSLELFIENQYDRLIAPLKVISKGDYVTRFIELDHHGYVWKDKVYDQLITEFNLTQLESESLLEDYLCHFKDHCVTFPHLLQTLKSLKEKDLILGIISNGKKQFQLDNIKALGIEGYFETILISEREGVKKPNPLIFRRALNLHELDPTECVYVGDHPIKDIKSAIAIGMISVWKKNNLWEQPFADFIINELHEVEEVVNKINKREISN